MKNRTFATVGLLSCLLFIGCIAEDSEVVDDDTSSGPIQSADTDTQDTDSNVAADTDSNAPADTDSGTNQTEESDSNSSDSLTGTDTGTNTETATETATETETETSMDTGTENDFYSPVVSPNDGFGPLTSEFYDYIYDYDYSEYVYAQILDGTYFDVVVYGATLSYPQNLLLTIGTLSEETNTSSASGTYVWDENLIQGTESELATEWLISLGSVTCSVDVTSEMVVEWGGFSLDTCGNASDIIFYIVPIDMP